MEINKVYLKYDLDNVRLSFNDNVSMFMLADFMYLKHKDSYVISCWLGNFENELAAVNFLKSAFIVHLLESNDH